jgi:hypothetical protein
MVEETARNWRKWRPLLSFSVVLGACLVTSWVVAWNFYTFRAATKWSLWSRSYESEVLSQRPSTSGELKHIEWDGWGWGGQDTTVYLVFDPKDSLSAAAASRRPGKFSGLPCEVFLVTRLENHWYTVQFYTDEFWGRRNSLNCSASES